MMSCRRSPESGFVYPGGSLSLKLSGFSGLSHGYENPDSLSSGRYFPVLTTCPGGAKRLVK